jgi:acetyl-CoA carboxylase biotin carboxyl carrier protein
MTDDLRPMPDATDTPHGPDGPAEPGVAGGSAADATVLPEPPAVADEGDASLLALIDRLAVLLHRSDLTELEVEAGGTALILRKPVPVAAVAGASAAPPAAGVTDGVPGSAAALAEPAVTAVRAPLTGIFYASPAPGSAPYVQVGGEVAVGQVIGLIEAMKLFNEIKSDIAGRVVRIVAENGQLVKAKHPLIEVEPL